MSLRMDIELTSARPDGTWTWRKAGARQPKGELDGTLLSDASVGDQLSVEYANTLDGIDILQILPTKTARASKHETIEMVRPSSPDQLVTTTLAPKGRGDRRGDRDRPRGDRDRPRRDGDRPRRDGDRPRRDGDRPRRDGERSRGDGGRREDRPDRRPRAPIPERPKARRLRPGRAHRNAALAALPPENVPIAEQVLRGGVPAVRQAMEQQNAENAAKGLPTVKGDELVALAESMLPALRLAEWRDRADAALSHLEDLDLRDLRSVVVASDGLRDEEARGLATQLREGLARRVEAEHTTWLEELVALLDGGRVVRALRVSSRPPKAGVPLPAELSARLVEATKENLTLDTPQDRWATVLDALSFSPVRTAVTLDAIPAEVSDELRTAVGKAAGRIPHIAAVFGIEATTSSKGSSKGPARRQSRRPSKPSPAPAPSPSPADTTPSAQQPAAPEADLPAPEADAASDAEAATTPSATAPVPEAVGVEEIVVEEIVVEEPENVDGPVEDDAAG